MRIKYKYVIRQLTNQKNIQTHDYLKTLLSIIEVINQKPKSRKTMKSNPKYRKTQKN
jgi:hypothetical protein